MGYEVNHNKCYSPKYNDGTIAPMQFHKSWDWLMPVVKKIEDYLSDNVGKVGYFDECLSSNDLNTRYQAVVEFIKNLKTIQYEN